MREYHLLMIACLAGCTFASTSDTPVLLQDGSTAYRYSGRANFGYQQDYADQEMRAVCAKVNGGRPLIVSQDTGVIGAGVAYGNGVGGIMANQQQELLFKCVK